MILPDFRIKELDMISPFCDTNLTPNGYDLTIGEIQILGEPSSWSIKDTRIHIPPKTSFIVTVDETITIPNFLIGILSLRSSYALKGVQATFGLVDAGYKGKLRLSLYNASSKTLVFTERQNKYRIAQISFHTLESTPSKLYKPSGDNFVQ